MIARRHPDVRPMTRAELRERSQHLPEQGVPDFLVQLINKQADKDPNVGLHPDKNATPSEPKRMAPYAFQNVRPSALLFERHSDTLKDVLESHANALGQSTFLNVQTGSTFEDQFRWDYIPRVFPWTLPYCVGGPDFKKIGCPSRRKSFGCPSVPLQSYVRALARRVEAQIRLDWLVNTALWNLNFRSMVNLAPSLALRFSMEATQTEEADGNFLTGTMQKLYHRLWKGVFVRGDGSKQQIKGDTTKLKFAVGLTDAERGI